jgi:hypothetical protein
VYRIEALMMGRPVMFARAKDEAAARSGALLMMRCFAPLEGREIVLLAMGAPLAAWKAVDRSWYQRPGAASA